MPTDDAIVIDVGLSILHAVHLKGYYQSLVDTQKNKTLNVPTLANAFCRTNLVNTDLNTWTAGSHI